jgi:DNA-binding XRE family transcriptional regulator
MPSKISSAGARQAAARVRQAAFRDEERAIREAIEHERREKGEIATTGVPTEPEDAIATAQFVGGLRRQREQAGLSLSEVARRSGIDKATLSRLENGFYPNPTVNTLARYARAIGKRLVLGFEDFTRGSVSWGHRRPKTPR